MTQNHKLKKEIRARMAETGEKYMVARRAILEAEPSKSHRNSGRTERRTA